LTKAKPRTLDLCAEKEDRVWYCRPPVRLRQVDEEMTR
jgi:hypothetical protein